KITLQTTAKAFTVAFPTAAITTGLTDLLPKSEFRRIDEIRNLLAHRVSGRRSIRGGSDGTAQWHEETWHIPGATVPLQFDKEMLHGVLDEITHMLKELIAPARQLAEGQTATAAMP